MVDGKQEASLDLKIDMKDRLIVKVEGNEAALIRQ